MDNRRLICCDMDRTILPNGFQKESPSARPMFRYLSENNDFILVYVTGRRIELIDDAIKEFNMPRPRFAAAHVGSNIYRDKGSQWEIVTEWHEYIKKDWNGKSNRELRHLLNGFEDLVLQEEEQQGPYKLSYYMDLSKMDRSVQKQLEDHLTGEGLKCSIIVSVDELKGIGLIDILPEKATKYHAVRFIMDETGTGESETVFAGDSGNDLAALTGGLRAILVNNARDEIKEEARRIAGEKGHKDRLYVARGGFFSMNGNYAAGVLEGVAYYFPEVKNYLEDFSL